MSSPVQGSYSQREATPFASGQHLDTPVREFMSPGVVSITEDASLRQTFHVIVTHRIHAVLVVGRAQAKPLGWVTARGLLGWMEREGGLAYARDAITERPLTIEPSATARDAITALSKAGVSHLLVCHRADLSPEGVVTAFDLMALATR